MISTHSIKIKQNIVDELLIILQALLFNSKQIEIDECLFHFILNKIVYNFIVKDLVSLINEKVKLMTSVRGIQLFFLGSI